MARDRAVPEGEAVRGVGDTVGRRWVSIEPLLGSSADGLRAVSNDGRPGEPIDGLLGGGAEDPGGLPLSDGRLLEEGEAKPRTEVGVTIR